MAARYSRLTSLVRPIALKRLPGRTTAWDAFAKEGTIRKLHDIGDQEMHTLSRVAGMGEVRSSRDFVFILNTIRQALGQ